MAVGLLQVVRDFCLFVLKILVTFAVVGTAIAALITLGDSGEVEPAPARPSPSPTLAPLYVPPVPLHQQSTRPHAVCRDGTVSYSVNRQGTCSWHGGVAYWLRP